MIIRDLTAPEIQRYVGLNENQLKRYYEPDPGLFICESEKVIRRAMAAGYRAESFLQKDPQILSTEGRPESAWAPCFRSTGPTGMSICFRR